MICSSSQDASGHGPEVLSVGTGKWFSALFIATMTDNRNPEAAWTYHDATKHTYASIRANSHFLDWANQPLPFKIYPTLELMRLPGDVRQTGVAALSAIAESVP